MTETGKEQFKKALKNATFFAAYVSVFALIWTIAVKAIKNDYILPALSDILKATGELFSKKVFYTSFLNSFLRVIKAFVISFIFAGCLAVAAKLLPILQKILAPIVTALRALPTMAIILILLVWSTPKQAPVIVAFLALFPMLYTGTLTALSTVDKRLVEMCKVYHVPIRKQIFNMYLPIASSYILREASAGLAFSLKLVVSAEILANTYISLGGLLQLSRIYLETAEMFALSLLVIAVGLILEGLGILLARLIERRYA